MKIPKLTLKINDFDDAVFGIAIVFLAIILRLALLPRETQDFTYFISPWYDFIKERGLEAFRFQFSNYSPAYLHFLGISVLIPLSKLYAIKLISIIFDFLLALLVALFVHHKYRKKSLSFISFAIALFLPTLLLNGAYWGQSDVIFTFFLLASVFSILKNKKSLSCVFFGVAFAFKLQAIFLFPLFLILLLKNKISFKHLILFPLPYITSILPSMIAGRPIQELLFIYSKQAEMYPFLAMNAPSLYQWLPQTQFELFNRAGLIFASSLIFLFIYVVYKKTFSFTKEHIIKIAFISTLLLPFLLPKMHERYFFPADIFSLVFAFYFPKYFFIPLAMQAISLISYSPFLWGGSPNFPLLSLGVLIVLAITIVDFLAEPANDKKPISEGSI